MRTSSVCLDASCVGKLFLDEPESAEFRTWYRQMRAARADFQSPTLLQFELGNVLRREFARDERKGSILAAALDGIDLRSVDLARPFSFAALTYYDAAYLCVAEEDSGALASYDDRMTDAAQVPVWTATRIRAAVKPGFVAWLKRLKPSKPPLRDFVERAARNDPLAQDDWSFLQFWGYLEGHRLHASPGPAGEALDLAFAQFAAVP